MARVAIVKVYEAVTRAHAGCPWGACAHGSALPCSSLKEVVTEGRWLRCLLAVLMDLLARWRCQAAPRGGLTRQPEAR